MRPSCLRRKKSWFPIEKCKTEMPIKRGSSPPSIKRTQLPSESALTSTVYKGQSF